MLIPHSPRAAPPAPPPALRPASLPTASQTRKIRKPRRPIPRNSSLRTHQRHFARANAAFQEHRQPLLAALPAAPIPSANVKIGLRRRRSAKQHWHAVIERILRCTRRIDATLLEQLFLLMHQIVERREHFIDVTRPANRIHDGRLRHAWIKQARIKEVRRLRPDRKAPGGERKRETRDDAAPQTGTRAM